MSGGIAYVLDEDGLFADRCNPGLVDLEPLIEPDDVAEARALIEKHLRYTGSTVAKRVLDDWAATQERFIKVMPRDYKRVLEERERGARGAVAEIDGVAQAASGG